MSVRDLIERHNAAWNAQAPAHRKSAVAQGSRRSTR